jgi:hypothetical protein
MDQIWIDMRDRVRNGYGWGQVCLTPENFLKLVGGRTQCSRGDSRNLLG